MYHSLKLHVPITDTVTKHYNTYDDFFLVPTSRPVINPPAQKRVTVDVPGANGVLDLTNSLTPYPVFSNRQGSIEFAVLNDRPDGSSWSSVYWRLMNLIHGRKLRIELEDDLNWFYTGYLSVNEWRSNSDGTWSNVTLDYDLDPYKITDYVTRLQYSMTNTTTQFVWGLGRSEIGYMPIVPKITTTRSNVTVWSSLTDYRRTFERAGTYIDPGFVFYAAGDGDETSLMTQGGGDIYLEFNQGVL